MTDQEQATISLAEQIQNMFEERAATQAERHAALQIVAAMLPLLSEKCGDLALPSNPS